jgi:hypothetical protein
VAAGKAAVQRIGHFLRASFGQGSKFGDSVMSKTDAAMVNEVLCKLLCQNLTCLIQEQETLGIAPVFWHDEEDADDGPAILPMVRLP